MIGIHIYSKKIKYNDGHCGITRAIGDYNITVTYHERYAKQVFYETEKHIVFVDGWIFNTDDYAKQAEYVLEKYTNDPLNFIYDLNGQFNIVICNKTTSTYVFYTDIFSLRKHFYHFNQDELLLSSDIVFIKENIQRNDLNHTHINKNLSLPRFIDKHQTFIKEINQVFSCMKVIDNNVLSYSIERVKHKYEIKVTNPKVFLEVVKRRIKQTHKSEDILLLLSGGLDSRFLLEVFKDLNLNIETATYGTEISDEVLISRSVAQCNAVEHYVCHLSPKDFIMEAERYIKETMGLDIFVQSSVYKFYNDLNQKILPNSIIDTGFALDAFLGGTQIGYDFGHELAVENRVFSALAIRQKAHREFYEDRYSMYDYEVYFLMRNLPTSLIKNHEFYYHLCEIQIKNSFHIPLQSTMFDLDLPPKDWKRAEAIQREKEKYVLDYFKSTNKVIFHNRYYSDFDMWIRADSGWRELIEKLFLRKESYLAKHFIDQNLIESTINDHTSGDKSHMRIIVKWISLEMFLGEFFDQR